MRNTWIILKREYLERVRTRTFLVLTLLAPAIMTALMILPAKLATMGDKPQHFVIVASTQHFGGMVRQQLLSEPMVSEEAEGESSEGSRKPEDQYVIDVDTNSTEAERASLRDKVSTRDIDGFLWLTDDAIAAHKVDWDTREMAGSREKSWIGDAVNRIVQQQEFAKAGLTSAQSQELLTPVKVESVRIERGREAKGSGNGRFLEIVVMVMLIYVAVLLYGISVMRSVLEEKTSRIIEVLLSSASSTELMTGKLLGVGLVGLTQIVVWTVMAGVIALPSLAAQPNFSELQISPLVMISFVLYFLFRILALQHDVRHHRRHYHDRAGGSATAISDRDATGSVGVHAGAGSPNARLCSGGVAIYGAIFRSDCDVRENCGANTTDLADRAVAALDGGDNCGPGGSVRTNLPHRRADLWKASHTA